MPRIRKILLWVLVAFVVYAVFTSPTQSADIVHAAWDILANGVAAIGKFFNSLLGR